MKRNGIKHSGARQQMAQFGNAWLGAFIGAVHAVYAGVSVTSPVQDSGAGKALAIAFIAAYAAGFHYLVFAMATKARAMEGARRVMAYVLITCAGMLFTAFLLLPKLLVVSAHPEYLPMLQDTTAAYVIIDVAAFYLQARSASVGIEQRNSKP